MQETRTEDSGLRTEGGGLARRRGRRRRRGLRGTRGLRPCFAGSRRVPTSGHNRAPPGYSTITGVAITGLRPYLGTGNRLRLNPSWDISYPPLSANVSSTNIIKARQGQRLELGGRPLKRVQGGLQIHCFQVLRCQETHCAKSALFAASCSCLVESILPLAEGRTASRAH